MTRTDGGPEPPEPRASTTARHHAAGPGQHNPPDRQAEVIVRGFAAAAPSGRRTRWAIIVPSCPWCSHLHIHNAVGPHCGRRTGSCVRDYRVVIPGQRKGIAS
jgi:ribosomal protein L32